MQPVHRSCHVWGAVPPCLTIEWFNALLRNPGSKHMTSDEVERVVHADITRSRTREGVDTSTGDKEVNHNDYGALTAEHRTINRKQWQLAMAAPRVAPVRPFASSVASHIWRGVKRTRRTPSTDWEANTKKQAAGTHRISAWCRLGDLEQRTA